MFFFSFFSQHSKLRDLSTFHENFLSHFSNFNEKHMRELHILIVDMLSTECGPNYDKNLHRVEVLHTKIPYIFLQTTKPILTNM